MGKQFRTLRFFTAIYDAKLHFSPQIYKTLYSPNSRKITKIQIEFWGALKARPQQVKGANDPQPRGCYACDYEYQCGLRYPVVAGSLKDLVFACKNT